MYAFPAASSRTGDAPPEAGTRQRDPDSRGDPGSGRKSATVRRGLFQPSWGSGVPGRDAAASADEPAVSGADG